MTMVQGPPTVTAGWIAFRLELLNIVIPFQTYLFIQRGLEPEISGTHHEFLCRLSAGLWGRLFRSVGQLTDGQSHRVPANQTYVLDKVLYGSQSKWHSGTPSSRPVTVIACSPIYGIEG